MKRLLCVTILVSVLLYLGIVVYVAASQDRFLYQPRHESENALLELAASRGLHPLRIAVFPAFLSA